MSRPSEAAFTAALLYSSQDAIIGADADFRVRAWNVAAEELFGYRADEIIGRPTSVLLPPGHESAHSAILARVLSGERVPRYETVRRRKDGELVHVAVTPSPVRATDGTVIGVSAICRAVTRVPRGEQAAHLLAAIVESSEDAIVSKDLDGIVTSWNRAAERIFGYSGAEMIGQSIRRLIPADRQSEEDEVLARVRAGQRVEHFETLRRRRDGSLVAISVAVSPVRDATGVVIGASKIARDITQQREAAAERERLLLLAQDEAATSRVLNDVGVVVAATLDRGSILQAMTETATRATGALVGAFLVPADQGEPGADEQAPVVAGVRKDALPLLLRARATPLLSATFRDERVVRVDDASADPRAGELADGDAPFRSYLAAPIRARRGDVLGGLVFGHARPGAFTERHERLVVGIASWASVALENARLYVAAQEANRLKDEFLATLSHELRTPLNAVLGYVRMLRSGVIEADRQDTAIETIERNAASLAQIVEDVLDVSRVVTGKLRLSPRAVDLAAVTVHAAEAVRPAADAKGVELAIATDVETCTVWGDPDRLQQVLWNLMSNAVKFTGRGGLVQVWVQRQDAQATVVVRDTGVGIPASFLPYVFERFRQAEGGSLRGQGGLGLGLAIARHLVEMHGGTIDAASDGEHRGATFRVSLPLAGER